MRQGLLQVLCHLFPTNLGCAVFWWLARPTGATGQKLKEGDVFLFVFGFNVESFFPKASAMLGFSFRRLREERDGMSGSGGRAVDELWTGGSCRNSMGGG